MTEPIDEYYYLKPIEPDIDKATKDLIRKEAKEKYVLISNQEIYIAGATVWAEKLKQERNKVIDECIDYFGEHYSEMGDDGSYITWTTFEVQKKLESLKTP